MVFEKEYIALRSSAEWIECLEMMPSWCRQVNWGNCRITWVNCAVLCVKDDCKGQFWGLRYCLSKLRSLLSFFPLGMTSQSKIAQFSWECIVPLTRLKILNFTNFEYYCSNGRDNKYMDQLKKKMVLDIHGSVHHNTVLYKWPNKMQLGRIIYYSIVPWLLYMFRAILLPIIRSI